ncbi:MAG: aquaporin [Candidatus Micrarchaeota archaeon]|nr:aquaporin [Candidatus Micrarchaeota archaeon]
MVINMQSKTPLSRKLLVEALGAFILVLIGVGSIISASQLASGNGVVQLIGIAMAHGLALALAVTIAMGISGGHINPAVTIAFTIARRIKPGEALAYILAQLAGATTAALFLTLLVPSAFGAAAGWGVPVPAQSVGVMQAIGVEAVITFLLMLAVYATAVDPRAPRMAGFGIGIMLAIDILAFGPLTGAAANPARALGPEIAAANFSYWYVYWIGPVLGAIVAALLYENLILSDKRRA